MSGPVALGPRQRSVAIWDLAGQYGPALGLALILVLPSWVTFGAQQVSVLRLSSLFVAAGVLASHRTTLRAPDWALLAYATILIVGLLQYPEPGAGRTVSILLTPVGFYIGVRVLSPTAIRRLVFVMVGAAAVGALTVVYEYAQGHAVFIDPNLYRWNASTDFIFRPGGIFGSPPGAGAVLCTVLLLSLASRPHLRGWSRSIMLVGQIVCATGLIVTFTRAPMIAFVAGLLLYLWLVRSRLMRPLPIAFALLGTLMAIAVIVPAVESTTTFQEGILREGSLTSRQSFWSIAMPIATSDAHNLLFGEGSGVLEAPSLDPGTPVPATLATSPQVILNSLHNQYLTILVENGLLGLFAFLAVLLLPFGRAIRVARTAGDHVAAAAAAGILAMAIVMTVGTTVLHGPTFAMMLVCLGIAAGSTVKANQDRADRADR